MIRKCFVYLLVALLALASALPDAEAVTLPGIAHQYSFDEGNGTLAADSIAANDATLQAFGAGDSQWITGMFGSAVKMTNENAYVITDSPLAAGSASEFSVSFWSRLDSKPNSNDSVLATPQTDNWITYNPTGNTNGAGKRGIGLNSVREANEPLLGIWEHYAVTFDRPTSTVTVYRDGALRDSGVVAMPSLNTRWVFGHNQDPGNTNGTWHGALDEIQIYDRVLSPSDVSTLAARPPQEGTSAHLVTPAQNFGSQPVGEYSTASKTLFLDPSQIDWIAWNRFPDRRAVSDLFPGELFLGTYSPEIDDHFTLTVTNPSGQSLTKSMDQNDAIGAPLGLQSMIRGTPSLAPDVVRGDNFFSPNFFDESGGFNSIFTGAGDYTFEFSFQNIGGDARYPDVYLLVHTAPPLPGDYNNDHVVNAADYTTWRNNLGASDESSLHFNGDGMNGVDFSDYLYWKINYGNTNIPAVGATVASTSVPEPAVIALVAIGAALLTQSRRTVRVKNRG